MSNEKDLREHDERTWGNYTVLEEGGKFKVKRIEVKPEKRLSYQSHKHRAEHWFVVSGTARVTLNDAVHDVETGSAIDIAVGDKHRVENFSTSETLVFIEIQQGAYLGEDDITRYEDDFGRHENK